MPRFSAPFALLTLTLLSVLSPLGCARQSSETTVTAPSRVLNVKDFGARGDGVSDDYDALQAAAAALCKTPGATLLFPAGTYRINRYRITGGPKENKVQNIRYVGCKGNTITGIKARVDVEGAFHRRADKKQGEFALSYTDSVVPFEMVQSSNFRIIGFELVGNVGKMSRDPGVAVGGAAGILTMSCHDYYIEDVTVDGFGGDGIRLGEESRPADQGVHLVNVSSRQNARQGLAILDVRGADVINSVFSNNGRTGKYGTHAPAAGVAIQPVRYSDDENPASDLTFDRCRFEENVGPQFLSERPDLTDSLSVKNSYIKSTLPDTSPTAFLSAARVGTIQGNTFDVGAGHGVALAAYSPELYGSMNQLRYEKNTFHLADNKGLIAPVQPAPVELVGNIIHIQSSSKDPNLLRLDYLKLFEDNAVFEANTGYSGVHPTILYEKGNATVRNNRYETDLSQPGYFDVYYGPSVATSGEIYQNPGSFKRYYTAAH